MNPVAYDFIKYLFEKDAMNFSQESIEEIKRTIKNDTDIALKVHSIDSPYWFAIEEEYIEMGELPIQVSVLAKKAAAGNAVPNSVYLFLNLKTAKLSDEVDIDE